MGCVVSPSALFANPYLKSCVPSSTPGASCVMRNLNCYVRKTCLNASGSGQGIVGNPCTWKGSILEGDVVSGCGSHLVTVRNPAGGTTTTEVYASRPTEPPSGWGEL